MNTKIEPGCTCILIRTGMYNGIEVTIGKYVQERMQGCPHKHIWTFTSFSYLEDYAGGPANMVSEYNLLRIDNGKSILRKERELSRV